MTSSTEKDLERGIRPPVSRHASRPGSNPLESLSRVSTRRSNRSQRYGGEDGYSGSVFETEEAERGPEDDTVSSEEKEEEKSKQNKDSKTKNGEDVIDVGWDGGDNDPLNPRQMSMAKRYFITTLMATTSTCV
jgi:hypothetical protein